MEVQLTASPPICTGTQIPSCFAKMLSNFCQILSAWYLVLTGLVQTSTGWDRRLDEMPRGCVRFPIPHPWIHLGNAPYRIGPIWTSQVRKHPKSVCESRKTRSEWKNYTRKMKKVILLCMSDTFDSFHEQAL